VGELLLCLVELVHGVRVYLRAHGQAVPPPRVPLERAHGRDARGRRVGLRLGEPGRDGGEAARVGGLGAGLVGLEDPNAVVVADGRVAGGEGPACVLKRGRSAHRQDEQGEQHGGD